MWEAFGTVAAEYHDAAEKLRAGVLPVASPEGTFPPGLPLLPFTCALAAHGKSTTGC